MPLLTSSVTLDKFLCVNTLIYKMGMIIAATLIGSYENEVHYYI